MVIFDLVFEVFFQSRFFDKPIGINYLELLEEQKNRLLFESMVLSDLLHNHEENYISKHSTCQVNLPQSVNARIRTAQRFSWDGDLMIHCLVPCARFVENALELKIHQTYL